MRSWSSEAAASLASQKAKPPAQGRARRSRSERAGDSRLMRTISASASIGTTPALTGPAGRQWKCLAPGTSSTRRCEGYEGIGWYGVILDGSWARAGKVQHLTFGRVMYHASVWLNGELLGEHIDGYLPFAFDVTGKLKDSANHLVVRVDNRPQIDWLPAAKQIEWVQYGGILQPVRIESKGPIFLSDLTIRAVPAGEGASVSCTAQLNAREEADVSGVALKISVFEGERDDRAVPLAQAAASRPRGRQDIPPGSDVEARACQLLVRGVAGPVHPGRDIGKRRHGDRSPGLDHSGSGRSRPAAGNCS